MDSVLRYVRVQNVKAARREEDVAVCVVQLVSSDHAPESDTQYLLVQRPEKGLLAGIIGKHYKTEFPCACMEKQITTMKYSILERRKQYFGPC